MAAKRYTNLDSVEMTTTFKKMLRWHRERASKRKDLSFVVPQAVAKVDYLRSNRVDTTITWIGHATFLIQCQGLNILTDPVWSNRMGLQKRMAGPGISIKDLPQIDVVLISHNHYDHLSFGSIRKLPGTPMLFVPQGLKDLFRKKGLVNVTEFEWWRSVQSNGTDFCFVPAQHWSKRSLFDTNSSLWGGWIVSVSNPKRNTGKTIYFAGDTGYFRGFQEVADRFTVDYAVLPIGCYEPEWFMQTQHMSPDSAVEAFMNLKAKYFVPMHYEAFRLGDDTPAEALQRLHAAWRKAGLAPEKLLTLTLGETIIPS